MTSNNALLILAKELYCNEKCDRSDFRVRARMLQSIWRNLMGFPIGTHNGRYLGSRLDMPWAKEHLGNYLTENIKKVVSHTLASASDKLLVKPRVYNDMLSSQPLCFNLFAELTYDLPLASVTFKNLLLQDAPIKVTRIEFEFSPGRLDPKYTADKTAFDVFVEFQNNNREHCFLGIEVKYHENLDDNPSDHKARYDEIASCINCFSDNQKTYNLLKGKPLQQIWRDHLLACSLILNEDYDKGYYVIIFPKDNQFCAKAISLYNDCLKTPPLSVPFCSWTLESVVDQLKQHTNADWVYQFYDRYLNFEKIDALLEINAAR